MFHLLFNKFVLEMLQLDNVSGKKVPLSLSMRTVFLWISLCMSQMESDLIYLLVFFCEVSFFFSFLFVSLSFIQILECIIPFSMVREGENNEFQSWISLIPSSNITKPGGKSYAKSFLISGKIFLHLQV